MPSRASTRNRKAHRPGHRPYAVPVRKLFQQGQRLSRFTPILIALALSACAEDEQACYDKLSADFDQYAEAARQAGDGAGAVKARESALALTLILTDDDRSACDYVNAGPILLRK